jgi:magnesium transporter
MLHRHEYKSLVWIDLESPTIEEVRNVVEEFGIDQMVADELLSPTLRPHTERYNDHLYLVLHFPVLRKNGQTSLGPEQEVDFIIGRDFIITTRYEELASFVEFRKVFEVNATLEEAHLSDNSFDVFLLLTKRLYRSVDIEIDEVRETLERIESEIFKGREKQMVLSLSRAGRDILNIKQALDPHQDILSSLSERTSEFAGKQYVARVRAIESMYYRSRKHVTRIWQTLAELRETNNSLLTTKQNEVMKTLTIMAFITFPLMLISSIFGMNTKILPIVGTDYDFWKIIGIMFLATFGMFYYFRHKNWI